MKSNMISGTKMATGDAFLTAVLGYATVFAGIVLLIIVVMIVGKLMTKSAESRAAGASGSGMTPETSVSAAAKDSAAGAVSGSAAAPGSAGELKLYDTDPKTAAMIMAIVADNLGKPLNELRFKSIREVKEDEI